MLVDFVFPDDLYCTLDVRTPMHRNSNLSKGALSKDSPNLVSLLDVLYFFESSEVFEGQDVLVLVI